MQAFHVKAMEQRRKILAGFKILASVTAVLIGAFILVGGLLAVSGHFDNRLDDLQREITRTRLELENLREQQQGIREQQQHIRDQVDELKQGQEELNNRQGDWLKRFEVRKVKVTAYAPLDPNAVEGVCYSGNPNVTASGSPPVPGLTAAGGREYSFGDVVLMEGMGARVINDRGGRIIGYNLDLVMASRREALLWGRQELIVVYEKGEV